jgi:YesN/AraC family two-component response regulator
MIPKILIVDDEQDVELLFRLKFRKEIKEGLINLHFAFSGEEALRFLKSVHPMDVMMVLSDINMPGMNGLQLVEKVKAEFPELKIIMVSAYGDDKNYKDAMSKGVDDFVTKPVDFELLKSRMSRIIAH